MSAEAAFTSAISPAIRPSLDPKFLPAILWNRAYEERCALDPQRTPLVIALARPGGRTVAVKQTSALPSSPTNAVLTRTYVERIVKSLLWQKGGSRIMIAGNPDAAEYVRARYAPGGARAFDADMLGNRIFNEPISVVDCDASDIPAAEDPPVLLGRNFDGCRLGFDLGGSDRKCAAVIDGKVVFSEEIVWDPYFQSDPQYHYEGIMDSLKRAAAHLPRVDAIGGSAAGVYVDNEPKVASLFRGVSEADFDSHVRPIFRRVRDAMGGVPFNVVNDGEVTALAGAISLETNAILGVAMGTSQASGYCDADGRITSWLNELAFVPVDYRVDAPIDEWSGDAGCGVQYFSQQAVARLAGTAGVQLPKDMPFAAQLVAVQKLMADGDSRARAIYETIGVCFGYSLAQYANLYNIQNLLIMGRVTSGDGGEVMLSAAREVLASEFPCLAEQVTLTVPDEKSRRVGQAVAAASLPEIPK